MCHHSPEIHNRNVHDLNLDLYIGSMSNINMPMRRRYATFSFLAVAMFALSVSVCDILTVEKCMTLTLIFRMVQYEMQIFQSKGHMRLSMIAIAMFVLSVSVCEIITFELPNVHDSNL